MVICTPYVHIHNFFYRVNKSEIILIYCDDSKITF